MKLEFALTFEEFVECHTHRLKLKESALPGLVAFIGLALIAFGYVLLRQGCEGIIAGIVLFAGLAVTALAVPVGLFSLSLRRLNINKQRAIIKEEFHRFHDGPRVFEADDSGWSFAHEDARNVRVWKNLSWFGEEEQTFVMADDLAIYALPKSILKEEVEQLRELCVRSLALQSYIYSVPLIPNLVDFIAVSFSHNWHKHPRTEVALYSAGLLSTVFLWLVLTDVWPGSRIVTGVLVLLVLPCVEVAYYWMQFRKGNWQGQFQVADISENGICLRNGTLKSTTAMFRLIPSRVVEVRENMRAFLVYTVTDWPYVVPKSQIPTEKMDMIRKSLFAATR